MLREKLLPIVAEVCEPRPESPGNFSPDSPPPRKTSGPPELPTLVQVVRLCGQLDILTAEYVRDGQRRVWKEVANEKWWGGKHKPMALRRDYLTSKEIYSTQCSFCLVEFYCLAFFSCESELFTSVPYRLIFISQLRGEVSGDAQGLLSRFFAGCFYFFELHRRLLRGALFIAEEAVRGAEGGDGTAHINDTMSMMLDMTVPEEHRYLRFMASGGIECAITCLQKNPREQAGWIMDMVGTSLHYTLDRHTRVWFPLSNRELMRPDGKALSKLALDLSTHPAFVGMVVLEPFWFSNWSWIEIYFEESP